MCIRDRCRTRIPGGRRVTTAENTVGINRPIGGRGMSQPMDALAKANKIRKARADLKREIAAGKVSIESILTPGAAIPWELESMPVCKLLTAQRRCGDRRAMV